MTQPASSRRPFLCALRFISLLAASVGLNMTATDAAAADVTLARFPSLSPDGSVVVFSWRGYLWRAASTGGEAVRLTSGAAYDARSAFTLDGARIIFESDRDGLRNLWSMRLDGSQLRQLTDLDASFALSSVGMWRGKPVAFIESNLEGDLYRAMRPYAVSIDVADGAYATPERVHDAFGGAPSSSPDGALILFERGGSSWQRRGYTGPDNRDVWLFDTTTGAFTRLTTHTGNDGIPRFISPDTFVSISDRGLGAQNLYRTKLGAAPDSGERLTDFQDADIQGVAIAASGPAAIVGVEGALWRVDLATPGAKPIKLSLTASEDGPKVREFKQVAREVREATLSPDGKTMAFVALGDVFVRAVEEKSPTRRVTEGEARERDICWSADGAALYFVSDSEGSDSIYAARVAETRAEARTRGRPKPAKDAASTAAPKSDESTSDESKTDEPKTDEPKSDEPKSDEPKTDEPKTDEPKTDQDAQGVESNDASKNADPARWADAIRFVIEPVTSGPDDDRGPVAAPDGKSLLFTRNPGNLARLDLASREVTILRSGWDAGLEYVYSPDGALIAFAENDLDFNTDIWIMPSDASLPPINVTRHPDNDVSPRFSADGRILAFVSERTNEEYDVWMVMLDHELEGMSQRDLDQYFKDAAEAQKKRKARAGKKDESKKDESKSDSKDESKKDDLKKDESKKDESAPATTRSPREAFEQLNLTDAFRRVRRVTSMLGDERDVLLAPTGDRIYFSAVEGKDRALFSIKYDGSEQKRIAGNVRVQALAAHGDSIVALSAGQAQTITPSGETKTIDISAESEINLARHNEQKLREASRIMARKFYVDPKVKGLDWAALTNRYATLAADARTPEEFDFVANTFIGHLDASHLGVRSPASDAPARRAHGRLGVETVAAEGGRRITTVLADSPAARANPALAVGDIVTSVDFKPVDSTRPLEAALAGRVGDEVFVGFLRPSPEPNTPSIELGALMVPVSSGAERTLRYTAETAANARKVEELSGGRLGYIHIASMDQASLDRFERDLYAAAADKDGLVVDVRNNGGGFTADRLLASIDVRPHAYTVPRGGDATRTRSYPQDRLFIQRYTMPMAMLCNEKSFSNAEIISHAFKTLGRGPLVGQQTAGGVISTGSESLVDGTTVRLPFRGWYLFDGTDMEENCAMPDFVVPQTPEDEAQVFDAQLAKAVEELLRDLGPKKAETR